jgi:streptogramin lyase
MALSSHDVSLPRLVRKLALALIALALLYLFAGPASDQATQQASAAFEGQRGYIFRFDPNTQTFTPIPIPLLGNQPVGVVAVNEGGRQNIWFTQSDAHLIGRLIYTDTVSYSFISYTIPTANSLPLNLTSSGDSIWFTEHMGNKIGRLVRATGAITEYSVPTANSRPADIDAAPDGSLWFSEQAGNKLARLNPTTGVITEYADATQTPPSPYQPYGVFVQDSNRIWIVEPMRPDGNGWTVLLQLSPSLSWLHFNIGAGTGPYDLAVDGAYPWGTPWVLERSTRRICEIVIGTLAGCLYHHPISPTPGVPTALVIESSNRRWFTKSDVGQLGLMTGRGGLVTFNEYPLPIAGLWPQGLDIADDGSIWIVAGPRYQIYLPIIQR